MLRKIFRSEKGANLVEAAVALPIVLILLFGVIDAARFVAAQNSANTVAHESARYPKFIRLYCVTWGLIRPF